jgi:hypothetical protein
LAKFENLFSAEKSKIFVKISEFFSKLHVQGSIIGQSKSTNFLEEFEQIKHQKQSLFYSNMPSKKNGFHK